MVENPAVLVVDDIEQNLQVLEKLLHPLPLTVVTACSGAQALQLAQARDFALAIVDVHMPVMDGYELARRLRANPDTAAVPIIFVSAIYADEFHFRLGYDAGAVDFIPKPFIPEVLLSKVRIFLELYNQRRQLESLVDELHEVNAKLRKQAAQLETSSEVGQRMTSILDPDLLLPQVTALIQAHFDYYAVGVWLLNESRSAVVLQAFNCRLPESPFERGHTLPVGHSKSIIARVCRSGDVYLANEVHADLYYMPIEELPGTRAELALPLRSGEQFIGALDIQSDRPHAFTPEDVMAMRALADQIAVAILNARLYSEVVRFNEQLETRVRDRTADVEKAYRHLELLDQNKADFIRVMSHELRTPLTLVRGYAQMLMEETALGQDASVRQMLQGIDSGAERLHELVGSMLDMGRIDTGTLPLTFQPLLLADLLSALRFELSATLRQRQHDLAIENLRDLPPVEGDVTALRKVFEHLLLNAIKYTPDGGRIHVTGRCMHEPGAAPSEQFVEIVVTDTGIGIAPEFQELIFMKFYQTGQVALHSTGRTKFKGGGPGLGLAIARGMVEAHGGRIWVESPGYDEEACPGSEFHVVLPVHPLPPVR